MRQERFTIFLFMIAAFVFTVVETARLLQAQVKAPDYREMYFRCNAQHIEKDARIEWLGEQPKAADMHNMKCEPLSR